MRRRAYGIYMRLEILKNLKSGLWHQLSRYQLTSGVFTCFNLKLLGHRIESKPISLQLQQHLIVQMWRLFQRLLRRTKRIYIYIICAALTFYPSDFAVLLVFQMNNKKQRYTILIHPMIIHVQCLFVTCWKFNFYSKRYQRPSFKCSWLC